MRTIIHRAESRGRAEHGWLRSYHTFSFAGYHNPERMHFGKLRVLNDDVVEPGQGFGTHGHDNMEIISIPLSGALRHKDSMGNMHVIQHGEIQVMSAGTGIRHSEYNHSCSESVNFLQIWVPPKERDIPPRYEQKTLDGAAQKKRFQVVVSPDKRDGSIWINQDAYFSLADFSAGDRGIYEIKQPGNGVYLFLIDGEIEVSGEVLKKRDAIGLLDIPTSRVELGVVSDSQVLCMEVPVK
jgi:redox-sensitive bicupin YhaK (pirin superfamily)